jgi:quercetin dioxygenase-like cupin family protein
MKKYGFFAAVAGVVLVSSAAVLPLRAEAPVNLEGQQYANLLTPLLSTSTTVIGQPIVYPTGPAKITAAVVTVPPGGETGWHDHEVPLIAYILEGALTVDYGEKGVHTFPAGTAVAEAIGWPHIGSNKGDVPVRLFAVYMGSEGLSNTIALPDYAK